MRNMVLYIPSAEKAQELFRETRGMGRVATWRQDSHERWHSSKSGGFVSVIKAVVLHDPADYEAGVMGCVRMSIVFKLSCIESSYRYWVEDSQGGKIVYADLEGNEVEETA